MKINKSISSAIAISTAVMLSTSNVSAEETSISNALEDCGIGAIIFPTSKNAALISNLIFDFGTTAYSSQTSSPSTCSGVQTTAAIFIDRTYPVLEEQFVKGGGSHVSTLLNILECGESVQQDVINSVQTGLATSFSDADFSAQTQSDKTKKIAILLDNATASCNA